MRKLQIMVGDKTIDTNQPPLDNCKRLIDCCELCGQYNGSEHEFEHCYDCPVLSLYQEWAKLKYQDWFDGWEEGTYQNGN